MSGLENIMVTSNEEMTATLFWPPHDYNRGEGPLIQISTSGGRSRDRAVWIKLDDLIDVMAGDPHCIALWNVARAGQQLQAAREAMRRLEEAG